jgi:hypothetical protein
VPGLLARLPMIIGAARHPEEVPLLPQA